MPDNVSSSTSGFSGRTESASFDDPTLDEHELVCRAGATQSTDASTAQSSSSPASSSSSPLASPPFDVAVAHLVRSTPPTAPQLPPVSEGPRSQAHNNAGRTAETNGVAPYANAGKTASVGAVYAGAALLKGRDSRSGLEVEVLSASGQVGLQEEWQAGLVRLGRSPGEGNTSIEAMTLRINRGIHNDDGSVGFNLGGQFTALGGEVTVGGANSLTLGLSASVGGNASVGVRDLDQDGNHELCAKISIGALTLGTCLETPL